jgi:hypothetical protein
MKYTNLPGRTTLSHSSVEIIDPIANEVHRYDDHLRDVAGRAAGTCRDHCCIVRRLFSTLRPITSAAAYVGCVRWSDPFLSHALRS